MKRYKVVVTKWYLDNHENTISYMRIHYGNEISAENYKKLFKSTIHKLKTLADGLPIIDDDRLRHLKLRKIRVRRFLIVYYIDEKRSTVFVLGIYHSSMNWQERLSKQIFDD